MNFNEYYIHIEENDALILLKHQHEKNRFKFYWDFFKDYSFLSKYQQANKEFLKYRNYVIMKYMQDKPYTDFYIDLNNKRIVCIL